MRSQPLIAFIVPVAFFGADQRLMLATPTDDAAWCLLAVLILLSYQVLGQLSASRRESKRLARERDAEASQLREAQALLHILTHDVAGPLFVIQSMSELQTEKTQIDPNKARQIFEKIKNAAQTAQMMLKVVKELEAIEAGKVELMLKPVPLLASLQSSLEILKPLAESKKVRVIVENAIPSSLMVLGERTILEHTIFHNLITNAIKFSKAGDCIEVRVASLDGDKVDIVIKDHGIGIPQALIPQLFAHDGKTSRRGTSGEKGTGLGLPLARRYVQRFGGSIAVQSQACEDHPTDHWTEFTLTLKKSA